MKIDESSINHNALRLIEQELQCIWDGVDTQSAKEYALMVNAKIEGIIEMANAMKENLKA